MKKFLNVHDLLRVVEVDDRLAELERAGLDGRILQKIAQRPTVEGQQATLQEFDWAIYWSSQLLLLEASINGEDQFSGHNTSEPTRPPTGTNP